jgi:hypothetical protein
MVVPVVDREAVHREVKRIKQGNIPGMLKLRFNLKDIIPGYTGITGGA